MATIKCGRNKGLTVEQVLAQSGGAKEIISYLAFIEKSFDDPKWGDANKKHHAEVKSFFELATTKKSSGGSTPAPVGTTGSASPAQILLEIQALKKYIHSEIGALKGTLEQIKGVLVVDKPVEPETPEEIAWNE
jgi:hypothetical protein